MKRRRLWLAMLALLAAVGGALAWLLGSEAGLRWAYPVLRALVPGTLEIGALGGRLAGPVVIDRLHWRDRDAALRAGRIELDWSPLALLTLTLRIESLAARDLELHATPGADRTAPPRLPLALRIDDVRLERVAAQIGTADPIAFERIAGAGHWRDTQLRIERLAIHHNGAVLELAGRLALTAPYPLAGELRWRHAAPGQPSLAGHGRWHGDARQLTLEHELTAPLTLRLRASIDDPLGASRWRAAGDFAYLAAPGLELRGELAAAGDRRQWRLERLRAAPAGSAARLHARASGGFDRQAPFEATVDWQALAWPLHGAARMTSPAGRLHIAGRAAAADAELDGRIETARHPPLAIRARARIEPGGLRLSALTLEGAGAALRAAGTLSWSARLRARLAIEGRDLDPALLWPDWPGRLAVRGTLEAQREAAHWSATATLDALTGTLREVPVTLAARARLDGQRLQLTRFELRAPHTELDITGEVNDRWQADWRLRADDLARLWPGAAGSLAGHGSLRGPRARPRIEAAVQARDLTMESLRLGRLDAELGLDLEDREPLRLRLAAAALAAAGVELETLDIEGDGRLGEHRLRARATNPGGRLALQAAGGYRAPRWEGRLERLDFDRGADRWQLDRPAPVALASDGAGLGPLCWRHEAARICGQGVYAAAGESRLEFETVALPLALFSGWLPLPVRFDGTLDSRAQARLPAAGALEARLEAALSPGRLSYRSARDRQEVVSHGGARLQVQARAGRLLGEARLALPGEGWVRVDGGMNLGAADPAARRVDLRLTADVPQLQALAPELPEIERLDGRLSAELRVRGTLDAPQLHGRVRLRNASARLDRLGVALDAIEAEARSDDGQRIAIEATARSGGGWLRARGDWSREPRPHGRGRLQITGERFEIVRTHEAWLLVSPDLSLELEPPALRIDGRLRVPRGRLAPRDLTQAQHESPDTVGVRPAADAVREAPWTVTGQLRLTVDEQLWFDGFGFAGWIAGDLVVDQEAQRPATGRGELRVVSGHYSVYGRRLEVDRGRLSFTLTPIDDPALDLRAVRRLPEVLVGVQATGTLRRPVLQLYSEPTLDQTDILSYLLFGVPATQAGRQEGGQLYQAATTLGLAGGEFLARSIGARFGIEEVRVESGPAGTDPSLVLGTYLSPKLYVSYGIGLLEPVNTLRLRYQLDPRWQIEAQSGAHQGADLFYTIRR